MKNVVDTVGLVRRMNSITIPEADEDRIAEGLGEQLKFDLNLIRNARPFGAIRKRAYRDHQKRYEQHKHEAERFGVDVKPYDKLYKQIMEI